MEFSELINLRRSVRAYKEGCTIAKSDIEEMIRCAQAAPTWKNSQTGRYYIITSEDKMAQFVADTLPEMNRGKCTNAVALIITTFVKNRSGFSRDGSPDNELGNEWGAYDLGLQNAQLILKARELGYDTLIMGIRDSDAIRKILSVPDEEEVVAVISVGVRESDPVAPPRKELEKICKFIH